MQRKRIGDLLVDSGVLTPEQLAQALEEQPSSNMRLGDLLIKRGYVTEQQLMEVLEFQLGIPHIQLLRQKIDSNIIHMIPRRLAEQHIVLPLRVEGNKLITAMADPLDYFAMDELRMTTGLRVEPVIASKDELLRAIERYYGIQEHVDQILQDLQDQQEDRYDHASAIEDNDSPVVNMVNQMIHHAVQIGASDIHMDPQGDALKIRYRVDGLMRTEQSLPPHMQSVMVARIKIMAQMDAAERRRPQDGRVEMDVLHRKIDIRISTLPTIHGEKVAMRMLDVGNAMMRMDRLGFSEQNLALFQDCLKRMQ